MQFIFFLSKRHSNFFLENISFVENLEMTQIAGGREGSCYLRHYDAVRT